MKQKFGFIFAALIAVALTACGEKVEVPTGHIAKVVTKDGLREGVIGTSKFRLDACWAYCDRLVLLNVADQATTENLEIFMPEDKLKVRVAIRTNLSINQGSKATEALFTNLSPDSEINSRTSLIGREAIYKTYAQQIIMTETREYLSQYTIAEVASSLEKVNADLRDRLTKSLQARTPFLVRYVGITDIKYPDIITEAQENAAKRREQIQQEEAQLEISRVTLERELQEAQLQRKIDVEKAEADAEADRVRALAVTPAVIRLRELENERLMYQKWNGQLPHVSAGEGAGLLLDVGKGK